MAAFLVHVSGVSSGGTRAVRFNVGFGEPADNTAIVRDAAAAMDAALSVEGGGPLALVDGPASLPAMTVIAHSLGHRFGAVAVWDPKLDAYVVAISHGPALVLGQTLPAPEKE